MQDTLTRPTLSFDRSRLSPPAEVSQPVNV